MNVDKLELSCRQLGIIQHGLVCVLVAFVIVAGISATTKEIPSASQSPAVISESSAGLKSQLETILRTAKEKKPNGLDDLVNALQIPDSVNWFSATFGEQLGANLSATYLGSWKDYEELAASMFRAEAFERQAQVFVKEYSPSSPAPSDPFIVAVLQNSKIPLKLYTASVGKDHPIGTLPGIYVYERGSFRLVNWRTFYDLPNVKPARIRVGTVTAVSQLIRQVNPVRSEEARKKGLQGTVSLHIVIDRDGSEVRVDPISGPQELTKESVEAVRRWLFKPTLLNGDPVEVDTTISMVFSNAE